jgi:Holliday junction resolvase
MPRRPRSESELKEILAEKGWLTTFIPTTPGLFDVLAFRPSQDEPTLYELRAFEVKERSGRYLYLNRDKIERIKDYEEKTGIPMYLAIKWKNGPGRSPTWTFERINRDRRKYRKPDE